MWYAPFFEVRYKSIAAAILKSGVKQVLELASGLALRGLTFTRDPEMVYVETDLEGVTEEKQALNATLAKTHGFTPPGNLHLTVANALDPAQLREATRPFRQGEPVAIITEGLLPYLSAEELEAVAGNVRSLLQEAGGLWITPDFMVKTQIENIPESLQRFRRAIADATGRMLHHNAFDSEADMLAFFERMGLRAQILKQADEAPEIVSQETLNAASRQIWDKIKPSLKLWLLKPI
jgi:O-methyltransferase involved in polyketide biosynthesis